MRSLFASERYENMSASPFVWKNSLKLSWQPFKKEHEDRLRPFNGFANLGIALADLNSSGNAFGWNRDRVGYAASLTKIAAMYAAFQLQASLKIFPGAGALKTAALQMQLEKEWRPELKNILGAVAAKNDFPQLAKIFVPNDPGFSFNKTFQSNLEGMIGPSHGWNAGYCIQAIGFDYIAAALIHGGFYSVKDSRGLWLSGDFVGGYQPGVDGTPAPGVEKTITDPSQRHQVATSGPAWPGKQSC